MYEHAMFFAFFAMFFTCPIIEKKEPTESRLLIAIVRSVIQVL
jgi:hypothetical protein